MSRLPAERTRHRRPDRRDGATDNPSCTEVMLLFASTRSVQGDSTRLRAHETLTGSRQFRKFPVRGMCVHSVERSVTRKVSLNA